jgi:hypothetical protein
VILSYIFQIADEEKKKRLTTEGTERMAMPFQTEREVFRGMGIRPLRSARQYWLRLAMGCSHPFAEEVTTEITERIAVPF